MEKWHLIEVKRICEFYEEFFIFQAQTYLPGSEDTVISKAVPSGRDSSIALRESWSLRFPLMWGTREHNLWELGTAFALSPTNLINCGPTTLPSLSLLLRFLFIYSWWGTLFQFHLSWQCMESYLNIAVVCANMNTLFLQFRCVMRISMTYLHCSLSLILHFPGVNDTSRQLKIEWPTLHWWTLVCELSSKLSTGLTENRGKPSLLGLLAKIKV